MQRPPCLQFVGAQPCRLRRHRYFLGRHGHRIAASSSWLKFHLNLAVDQAMLFGSRALQGAFAALMAPAALSILTITFQNDAGRTGQSLRRLRSRLGCRSRHRRAGGRCPHRVRVVAVVPSDQRSHRLAGRGRGVGGLSVRAGPAGQPDTTSRACCSRRPVWSAWSTGSPRRSPTAGRRRPRSRLIAVGVILLAAFVVVEARSASSAATAAGGRWNGTGAARTWPHCSSSSVCSPCSSS